MAISVNAAKSVMKRFPAKPEFSPDSVGELSEIFSHPFYTTADETTKKEIGLKSAMAKYQSEKEYPWDFYFDRDITPFLKGKTVLDLGCFTGGRGIAWAERYGFQKLVGVDVREEFIEVARAFAEQKNIHAKHHKAFAERLPFFDQTFDAIVTFDVFEHVADLGATMAECFRVLKPGGHLLTVFPGYFHPIEHHLSLATRLPGIHYMFSPKTLVEAYYEIIKERGQDAEWYQRSSQVLLPWERGNRINGTTARKFRRIIHGGGWSIIRTVRLPLGRIGRRAARNPLWRGVSLFFAPLARLPLFEEFFLHRITYILQKPKERLA